MIIDRQRIKEQLKGLIGIHEPNDPTYTKPTQTLLTSTVGRFVNDVHPLINIENIDQTAQNVDGFSHDDYNGATVYSFGARVTDSSINYRYIRKTPASGNAPTDADFWEVVDPISDLLYRLYESAINRTMDSWINDKKIRNITRSIEQSSFTHDGIADYDDLESNANDFVGVRIRLNRGASSLAVQLKRIETHFTGTWQGLTMYVYHSSTQSPLHTFTVDSVDKSVQVKKINDIILRYYNDTQASAGEFFIGYKQSDLEALGGQAITMKHGFSRRFLRMVSPLIQVNTFRIEESSFNAGTTMFDPDDVSVTASQNFGLNLELSIKNDVGQFIIDNKEDFADALANAYGLEILRMMAFTTRKTNDLAESVSIEAKKEVYSSDGVNGTVMDKFKESIKALNYDLSGLFQHQLGKDENYNPVAGVFTLR